MTTWDPAQYAKFATERAQPFWDLAAMVGASTAGRLADLGCGSGELTAALADRLAVGDAVGIDNSASMLAAAAAHARPGLRFEHGDIATWTADGAFDLVLANAALQWVPDHPAVLARWAAALAPGGWLAVQVPANADHASHLAISAVAAREPFASAFGAAGAPPDPVAVNVLRPEQYAAVLYDLGFPTPAVRLQVYPHVLASTADVVEWTKGTSLTRIFGALPGDLHQPFVDAYRAELIAMVGDRSPYLYTFKRILMVAQRP